MYGSLFVPFEVNCVAFIPECVKNILKQKEQPDPTNITYILK
jgi:hypothetical protein